MDEPMTFEWPDWPAPGEDTIPDLAPPPMRLLATEAGVWVDGGRGIYAPVRMVERAIEHGYQLDPADASLLEWAQDGFREDAGRPDFPEFWDEFIGEVEEWLNEHVAPIGYTFGWVDGDFMLAHDIDWCVWSGEDPIAQD